MSVLYTNNASATLSASITNAATSFSVSAGQGALFPAITGSDFFYVTLTNTAGTVEIVKVTARSTDTFTVVRGQDGTSAVAWSSGDNVELRVTKAMLDQFKTDTQAGITSSNVTTALGYTPQSQLVSGTNIKTVNSTSLLGSGNIAVEPTITAGTTDQYWRGDKTWQTLPTGGDASTNTALSVDSEVVLFSGTGGKTLKRATGSGLAKLTSGVLSTAVAGTDYLAPAAIGVTVQAYDADLTSWSAVAPSAKQDTLVSGTNIKTVNGSSLLGSGDLAIAPVPSGTAMLFVQTSAPTGWTKVTTHNDKTLRVVSGTASSGGTVAFSTAFASQSVAGTIGNTTPTGSISVSGTVGGTTLAQTNIPNHTHTYMGASKTGVFSTAGGTGMDGAVSTQTGAIGGGGSHTHTFSGSGSFTGTAHNHTFTGTAINLAVQYVDVIIATKN